MASPELLLFFMPIFRDIRAETGMFAGLSAKSFTTENTEKYKTGELSLAEYDFQAPTPVFCECDPCDFDFRG